MCIPHFASKQTSAYILLATHHRTAKGPAYLARKICLRGSRRIHLASESSHVVKGVTVTFGVGYGCFTPENRKRAR